MKHRLKLIGGVLVCVVIAAAVGILSDVGRAVTTVRPANLDPPQISGTPQVGSTLTATEGRWSRNPTDINLQWRRCDENGGSCSNISGAKARPTC